MTETPETSATVNGDPALTTGVVNPPVEATPRELSDAERVQLEPRPIETGGEDVPLELLDEADVAVPEAQVDELPADPADTGIADDLDPPRLKDPHHLTGGPSRADLE